MKTVDYYAQYREQIEHPCSERTATFLANISKVPTENWFKCSNRGDEFNL